MDRTDPLAGPPPDEVPLPHAPLERVIAQVRFSPILAARNPASIIPIQERIREDYPELRQENVTTLVVGGDPQSLLSPHVMWRFLDRTLHWQAIVSQDFVAIETSAYTNRMDFLNRLEKILAATEKTLKPSLVTRLGLRYIDRVRSKAFEKIDDLVNPDLLGLFRHFRSQAHLVSSEALLQAAEGRLRLRWGLLPAGNTFDPAALPPIDEQSWVLDLDMFTEDRRDFVTGELCRTVQAFAERIYAVFRWAVTDEFLRHYGGER